MPPRTLHLKVLPQHWNGERPKFRADCEDGPRPCPFVGCRLHLLIDVDERGRLFKTRDFDEDDANSIVEALHDMPQTCAWDVGQAGNHTQQEVARLLNVDQSSVSHTETSGMRRARAAKP